MLCQKKQVNRRKKKKEKKRQKQKQIETKQKQFKTKQTNYELLHGNCSLHNYPQINNRLMILPDTAVTSCLVDVLLCVVTAFVPVDVSVGRVVLRAGWTKQIPRQVAVQET